MCCCLDFQLLTQTLTMKAKANSAETRWLIKLFSLGFSALPWEGQLENPGRSPVLQAAGPLRGGAVTGWAVSAPAPTQLPKRLPPLLLWFLSSLNNRGHFQDCNFLRFSFVSKKGQ